MLKENDEINKFAPRLVSFSQGKARAMMAGQKKKKKGLWGRKMPRLHREGREPSLKI